MLILASSSPRRRKLLRDWGYEFKVISPPVKEELPAGTPPETGVRILAERKAEAGLVRWLKDGGRYEDVILAADTMVVLAGQTLGKPAGAEEAAAMLLRLSGKEHSVLTGVAVRDGARLESGWVETRVRFRDLSAGEIAAYVGTGEPLDKAGAYGIQGAAGAFVREFAGSLSNVIGLPMEYVTERLKAWGIRQERHRPA
ncbi:septum formation protein Maf [Peptococcaceae bacterium CEB3]|nr:septum formation protein Maf [Peptococcaceae bacterium CEB3]